MEFSLLLSGLPNPKLLQNAMLHDYDQLSWYKVTVSVIVAVFSFQILKFFIRVIYNLFFSPLRRFPGPRFAAASELWEIYRTIKNDRFRVIHNLHEKHGDVVRIGPNQVSVASPHVFHHVFVAKCSSFLKSNFYETIQPGLGPKYAGLFNYIDHQRALSERRDLQPMFSPANIKLYEKRYDQQLDKLVAIMKERSEIDLFGYFKFLLLDVIGDLSFNETFGQVESGEEHQYVKDFNNAFMLIGLQNAFAFIIPFIPYLPFKGLKDAYFGLQRVFEYSQARVKEYLARDASDKTGTLMSGYLDVKSGKPKEGYSSWSIALAGHGFIIAGSEATSITLTYIIWNLIKYPEVDRKLRAELSTLPADYSSTELAKLPYMDGVIRETLRIYPPAPSPMPRIVPASGLSIENVTYPPKTIISAQPYTIHRCADVFDQPEEFRPERWMTPSPEQKEQMYRAFIPFSAGQRGCIGRGLAWMHMMKALARILGEFERFELARGIIADDMELVERGALAKPKATKMWVKTFPKKSE